MTSKKRCYLYALFFVFMVAVLITFLFERGRSNLTLFKRFSRTEKRMSIDQFQENAKKCTIVHTELYYIPFSNCVYEPLSEDGLLSSIPYLKVIGSIQAPYPKIIADVFDNNELMKSKDVPHDFRYSCLMYSKSNEVICFSISRANLDILFINGQPYEVSFGTIDALLKLLPAVDYELAIKEFGTDINLPTKDNIAPKQ